MWVRFAATVGGCGFRLGACNTPGLPLIGMVIRAAGINIESSRDEGNGVMKGITREHNTATVS
jgi:hypothetical protein